MKTFLLFALCVVVCWELSHSLPLQSLKYRLRREVADDEVDPKLKEIYEYVAMEMIKISKDSVENISKLLEKVIEEAEESDLKSENLTERIDKLKILLDQKNEAFKNAKFDLEDENEKSVDKLMELFATMNEVVSEYDELENPTKEQNLIRQIFKDNKSDALGMKFFFDFMTLRTEFDKRITAYINGMTSAEKQKHKELMDWFDTFKNVKGVDGYVDTIMKFLELFEDDDD